MGFHGGSAVKNLPVTQEITGYTGLIPGLGGSPGEGHGNPLVFLPGDPMDKGAWQATVHGVAKSRT